MSELRRLRYFLAVAEERSVTRAAARLHIAQPALSRQLRQLEAELGVRLVDRGPQGVEPTEAGALLAARGAELLGQADLLWQDVRALAEGGRSLVFGYTTSTGYETAPALLAELAAGHPELRTTVRLLPASDVTAGVADGTLDAGLVRCPPPTPGLVRTVVRLERQGVLVQDGHPLADAAEVDAAALSGETLLIHPREDNPGHYDAVMAILARAGGVPGRLLPRIAFDAAHTPVARGEALSVVGESAASGLPAGLVWRPLAGAPTVDVQLLTRGATAPPAVAHLLRAAARAARDRRWLRPPGPGSG